MGALLLVPVQPRPCRLPESVDALPVPGWQRLDPERLDEPLRAVLPVEGRATPAPFHGRPDFAARAPR